MIIVKIYLRFSLELLWTKEVGRERVWSREETLKKRGFQTPGNILAAESVASLGSTEGNITGKGNK